MAPQLRPHNPHRDTRSVVLLGEMLDDDEDAAHAVADYRAQLAALAPRGARSKRSPSPTKQQSIVVSQHAPEYCTHEQELRIARLAFSSALADSSASEHRALATGAPADAQAYIDSLSQLEEASAKLWAVEAYGAQRKRVRPAATKAGLASRLAELTAARSGKGVRSAADLFKIEAERAALHAHMEQVFREGALPDVAIVRVLRAPRIRTEPVSRVQSQARVARRNNAVAKLVDKAAKRARAADATNAVVPQ